MAFLQFPSSPKPWMSRCLETPNCPPELVTWPGCVPSNCWDGLQVIDSSVSGFDQHSISGTSTDCPSVSFFLTRFEGLRTAGVTTVLVGVNTVGDLGLQISLIWFKAVISFEVKKGCAKVIGQSLRSSPQHQHGGFWATDHTPNVKSKELFPQLLHHNNTNLRTSICW